MAITRNEFAFRLLNRLGIEPRKRAVTCLVGWMVAESGDNPCNGTPGEGAKFNPLNTTKDLGPSCDLKDYNSTGVKNYASVDCGLRGTTETLNLAYYDGIMRALRKVMWPGWRQRFATAVGESPWGTSAEGVLAGIEAAKGSSKWGALTVG